MPVLLDQDLLRFAARRKDLVGTKINGNAHIGSRPYFSVMVFCQAEHLVAWKISFPFAGSEEFYFIISRCPGIVFIKYKDPCPARKNDPFLVVLVNEHISRSGICRHGRGHVKR